MGLRPALHPQISLHDGSAGRARQDLTRTGRGAGHGHGAEPARHPPQATLPRLVLVREDPLEEIERRILAACAHYGITQADLDGWLFVNSGREDKIIIATQTKSGTIITAPTVDALKTEIRAKQIDVLAIDPFVLSHQVSENDNMAIASVANSWAAIADGTEAAVALPIIPQDRRTGGQRS